MDVIAVKTLSHKCSLGGCADNLFDLCTVHYTENVWLVYIIIVFAARLDVMLYESRVVIDTIAQ